MGFRECPLRINPELHKINQKQFSREAAYGKR